MPLYKAPLEDMRFVLHELHDSNTLTELPGCADYTPELLDSVLEEAAKFAEEVLFPLNQIRRRARLQLRERRRPHARRLQGRL